MNNTYLRLDIGCLEGQLMKYSFLLWLFLITACENNHMQNVALLGSEEFTIDKWAQASQPERAKMLYSFLSNNTIQGMSGTELQSYLGSSTGYYEYDEYPAYIIGPDTIEGSHGKGYLLAFPIDRDTGKVKRFVIDPPVKPNI